MNKPEIQNANVGGEISRAAIYYQNIVIQLEKNSDFEWIIKRPEKSKSALFVEAMQSYYYFLNPFHPKSNFPLKNNFLNIYNKF